MTILDSLSYLHSIGKLERSERKLHVYTPSEVLLAEDLELINALLFDFTANLDQDVVDLSDEEFTTALRLGIQNTSLAHAVIIQVASHLDLNSFTKVQHVETIAEVVDPLAETPAAVFEVALQVLPNELALFWKRVARD